MSLTLGFRSKVLIGVALGSLALVIFMPADETVEATHGSGEGARPLKSASRLHSDADVGSLTTVLRSADRVVKDTVAAAMFSVQSWYVAPPPPAAAPVVARTPPPPSAPPLPFAFMGSYKTEDGTATYFLTAGDRVYDVKIGDTLDNTYSVDGVNTGQLMLTYLPMKIQQALAVGEE